MTEADQNQSDRPTGSQRTTIAAATTIAAQLTPGDRIDHYVIRERIGEGGFAVVYRAEQTEPVRRDVALKVIKLGMDTKQVIARFEAERQALAMMDHANVARVFDAGATETGRPYFVMEHVPGDAITDYCDRHRLSTRERLDLFIQTCDAVQHAHQKGIIHRDIKPSNVLVSVKDGAATVKVIDFGVAKATQQRLSEQTIFTEQGQLIGTPEYMSPEQAEMRALDIDTRSDVYSLGVLLYELLAGTLPFDSKSLRQAGLGEIQRIIREEEPRKPSTKLSSLGDATTGIAQRHRSDPRTLVRTLRGDLDWIAMRCLEKDRTRRYETVNGLAADIQRHLKDEPVAAGPPSAGYRLSKFVRRNRAGVTGVAAVFVVLLLGIGGTMWGLLEAVAARDAEKAQRTVAEKNEQTAKTEAAKAKQIADFTQEMLAAIDPRTAGDLDKTLMRLVLDNAASRVGEELNDQPEVEAAIRRTIGLSYKAISAYDDAETHLTRSHGIRARILGENAHLTLSAEHSLAGLYRAQGRFDQAEEIYLRHLEIRTDALGRGHAITLSILRELAGVYRKRGRFAESEALLLELVEGYSQLRGVGHVDTIDAKSRLATLRWHQGRYHDAEPIFLEVIESYRRHFGVDHPATLFVMNNLGTLYGQQRRLDEAEAILTEALEGRRRVLGTSHNDTLETMNNLALIYDLTKRFDRAEAFYAEIIEKRRDIIGDDHPATIRVMMNLGLLYENQDRLDEAEALLRRVVVSQQRVLGDEHPQTLMGMHNLAGVYRKQGRLTEAHDLHQDVLEVRLRTLGEDHPDTLRSKSNLAYICESRREYVEAAAYYTDVLETGRRVFHDQHSTVLYAARRLLRLPMTDESVDSVSTRGLALRLVRQESELDDATATEKHRCAKILLSIEIDDFRDPGAGLRLAIEANTMTDFERPAYLDTLALAYHMTGDTKKAVETQKKALSLLPADAAGREEYEAALARYEAAVAEDSMDTDTGEDTN